MTAAAKYRKKPVEIDAIQWDGVNIDAVLAFINADDRWKAGIDDGYVGGPGIGHTPPLGTLDIPTLEGTMTANAGDWIIRGVKGELYPCKPDVFDATYDESSGWEPTRWTIEAWSDVSTEDEAGDLVHEACAALMAEMIRRNVKHPAIFSTGKGGPRTRARIEAARKHPEVGAA